MKTPRDFLANWGKVIATGLPLTALLAACRLLGWLQPLELAAYDLFFQWRPLEAREERIVIVGLQESDVKKYYPLTDRTLAQLLRQISSQQPAAIALDFYRDVSVAEGTEELGQIFETAPNLIGIEKVIGGEQAEIAPPPRLKQKGQVAASDVVVDGDGILRRGLLVPVADGESNLFSLGATLALLYLQERGITPATSPDSRCFNLAQIAFCPFQENDGGYHQADAGGFQILLNFRNPQQSFQKVSFSDVLEGRIDPQLFRQRLVFIGSTAPSVRDEFYTPFSRSFSAPPQTTYGVEIQANIASHLLSAVLDGRETIRVLPEGVESGWIAIWGILAAAAIWRQRDTKTYLVLAFKIIGIGLIWAVILGASSYLAFLSGWWLPVVPSLLEIGLISLAISGLILQQKNQELQQLFKDLSAAQEQIILEKKQAALANLVAGVAHEVNNPLNFILNFADLSVEWAQKLREAGSKLSQNSDPERRAEVDRILSIIEENLQEILTHGQKAARITQTLLRQARSESAELTLTDLNELVDSTFQVVTYSKQVEAGDFSLHLESDYDPTLGEREIAAEALNQVLIDLIDNACDAALEKKRKLGEAFEPTVAVTTQLGAGPSVEIVVADNGDGIAPAIAGQIFEPFKTTKPPGEGTGLGLYVTYELVKKQQWQIRWLREGDQTKFCVILPVPKEN